MDKCSIGFKAYTIVDDKMWIFSNNFNGLYVLNLLTEEFQWKGQVPFEAATENELYTKLIYWEGKIFLIPFFAHKLAVYDMVTEKFEAIDLPGMEKRENLFFGTACLYQDAIFMFPFFGKSIVKISLRSGEVCAVTQWVQDAAACISNINKPYSAYFRMPFVLREGKIYTPFYEAHAVLELNCANMETRIHVIDEKNHGYSGICAEGNNLWLASKGNGKVVQWNLLNDQKKLYSYDGNTKDFGTIEWINNQKELGIFQDVRKCCIDSIPQLFIYSCRDMHVSVCNERYSVIWDYDKEILRVYNKELEQGKDYLINVEYKDTPLGRAFQEVIVKESTVQTESRLLDAINHTMNEKSQEEMLIGEKIYQKIIH